MKNILKKHGFVISKDMITYAFPDDGEYNITRKRGESLFDTMLRGIEEYTPKGFQDSWIQTPSDNPETLRDIIKFSLHSSLLERAFKNVAVEMVRQLKNKSHDADYDDNLTDLHEIMLSTYNYHEEIDNDHHIYELKSTPKNKKGISGEIILNNKILWDTGMVLTDKNDIEEDQKYIPFMIYRINLRHPFIEIIPVKKVKEYKELLKEKLYVEF